MKTRSFGRLHDQNNMSIAEPRSIRGSGHGSAKMLIFLFLHRVYRKLDTVTQLSKISKSETSRKTHTQISKSETFRGKRHDFQETRHTPLDYTGLAVNAITAVQRRSLLSSFPHPLAAAIHSERARGDSGTPPRYGFTPSSGQGTQARCLLISLNY
jgi:hypothetical protein